MVEGFEIITGELNVGNKGLFLGNEIAATYDIFPWPFGRTNFLAFCNTPGGDATQITLILDPISNKS